MNLLEALITDKRFAQEHLVILKDGEVLFREGDLGREMFIVRDGGIRIEKNTAAGSLLLATLTKGDFVGEMALLESMPRSATATAVGNTELVALQPGGFLLKIRRDPTLAFEMLQGLSRRIRQTNEKLLSALVGGRSLSHDQLGQILSQAEFKPRDVEHP